MPQQLCHCPQAEASRLDCVHRRQGCWVTHHASADLAQGVDHCQGVRPAGRLKVQGPLITQGLIFLGERVPEVLELRSNGRPHYLGLQRGCREAAGRKHEHIQ